ncbi:MAG: hypothetical protein R3C49_14690 [Planctomycetaceae bacterium]
MTEQSLIVIGNAHRREFGPLAQWLIRHPSIRVIGEHAEIRSAVEHDPADLTIVLQSWSDQYTQKDINLLIGHTLFRRLFCCYGPWCESDGRNRSLWPDAVRIPIRLSESVIEHELKAIRLGQDAIPPTASGDEIFSHRISPVRDVALAERLDRMNGAVVGADRVFRRVLAQTLRSLGLRNAAVPLIRLNNRDDPRPQSTERGPIHFVFHDLDPWGPDVQASLAASHHIFPDAVVVGVATMHDGGLATELADDGPLHIVPKLDPQHGLEWWLRNHIASQTGSRP